LPTEARILNFVNVDLIAAGLSPLRPELAAVAAARVVLEEIVRLIEWRADFAWESTLSGLTYAKRIRAMKELGYHVGIIYLQLASPRRKPRGVRRECMERRSTCGSTAKSSQSAPDAAAIPFRQIAELMLVVQGEEPVRGWAHRGVSTPTHQCARFSKVE